MWLTLINYAFFSFYVFLLIYVNHHYSLKEFVCSWYFKNWVDRTIFVMVFELFEKTLAFMFRWVLCFMVAFYTEFNHTVQKSEIDWKKTKPGYKLKPRTTHQL